MAQEAAAAAAMMARNGHEPVVLWYEASAEYRVRCMRCVAVAGFAERENGTYTRWLHFGPDRLCKYADWAPWPGSFVVMPDVAPDGGY